MDTTPSISSSPSAPRPAKKAPVKQVATAIANYTHLSECACGCKKTLKVPTTLFVKVGDAKWFRKRHNPRFHSDSVSFESTETE